MGTIYDWLNPWLESAILPATIYKRISVPDQFILSKTKLLDLAKMEPPNILNKGEERRLTPSNHQDLADMRITNVIHRVRNYSNKTLF